MSNEQNPRDDIGGTQTSEVSGLGSDNLQETTPPADLTQHRSQGPGRDYRADAPHAGEPGPEVEAAGEHRDEPNEEDQK